MIEILLNDVTLEGNRRVRVVSDACIDASTSPVGTLAPLSANVRMWSDDALGLHYLEATWPCREAVKIRGEGWKGEREMVLWKLGPGERVSQGLKDALAVYGTQFKVWPAYAFLRKLPSTIENGFEAEDMLLFEAEWVPPGCIALYQGDEPPSGFAHFPQIAESAV